MPVALVGKGGDDGVELTVVEVARSECDVGFEVGTRDASAGSEGMREFRNASLAVENVLVDPAAVAPNGYVGERARYDRESPEL